MDTMRTVAEGLPANETTNPKCNLPRRERKAQHELQKNKNIIIQEADEDSCVVIIDRDYYQTKINNLLSDNNTYKQVEISQTRNILHKIKHLISNHSGVFTDKEKDYLNNCSMTESYIYGLPKIHKSKSIKEAIEQQRGKYVTMLRPHEVAQRHQLENSVIL